MTEPTTEEKIEQLVRSVLEAVDSRLESVRHEMSSHIADLDERHRQTMATIESLERRIAELTALPRAAAHPAHPAPAFQVPTTQQPIVEMHVADGHYPPADLSMISRPLMGHGHITTQVPTVPQPIAIAEPLSAPPPPPPSAVTELVAAMPELDADVSEEIDIEQLTSLLSERLGHLSLPVQSE